MDPWFLAEAKRLRGEAQPPTEAQILGLEPGPPPYTPNTGQFFIAGSAVVSDEPEGVYTLSIARDAAGFVVDLASFPDVTLGNPPPLAPRRARPARAGVRAGQRDPPPLWIERDA